jgi:OmpA-OmpF porin, OOP family
MKKALTALALTTLVWFSADVLAQNNPNVNMDDFAPSVHAWDTIGVGTTRINKGVTPNFGLWTTYRRNALKVVGGGTDAALIQNQLVGDFYGAFSILGWASIGLDVPVFFMSDGESPASVASNLTQAEGASLGDIRASAKIKFWDNGNKGFGLGLMQDITMPTASGDNFTGEDFLTSRTNLILDYQKNGWSLALNLGYLVREDVESFAPPIRDELLLSAGLVVPIICDDLELLLTSNTRTAANDPFASESKLATNFIGGLRGRPINGLVLTAAGGSGYGTMPGNAEWQAMLNIGFERKPNSCDLDGDGLCDADDECPEIPGPVEYAGCPDKDRDGILDSDDLCPDHKGSREMQGCPDRDKDGIADRQDKCPEVAGLAKFNGCPDSDGDGIIDDQDKCPKVAGVADFAGCPDSDGDSIEDAKDECPEVPGKVATKGCPDKDDDYIADSKDKCPDVWGTPKFEGCPPPTPKKVQITKTKIIILDKVYFATNKSKIKSKSYSLLKDVATVLKDNAWVKKVRIEGHTDDTGKHESNVKLSQARAEAVKTYLIKQGVASERLEAVGHGPDKPLVNDTTKEARAQNRRVEFSIVEN